MASARQVQPTRSQRPSRGWVSQAPVPLYLKPTIRSRWAEVERCGQLRRQTADVDFAPVYQRLEQLPILTSDAILSADKLITSDTMAYAKR